MKLALVHLSDIHIKQDAERNPVLIRTDKIASAVAGVASNVANFFVVVSGDIASSGLKLEYSLASQFLKDLHHHLTNRLQELEIHFVFVPGNHDCDFSKPNNARKLLIKSITEEDYDETVYTTFLEVQENFHYFTKNWTRVKETEESTSHIYWVENYNLRDFNVKFQLLNTALMSSSKEKQGKMIFPTQLISVDGDNSSSSELVITVMHHPYSWFDTVNARALRNKIEPMSDLILTGHEHEGEHYRKERFTGVRIDFIEGGVLQDAKHSDNSHFSVIVYDFQKKSQHVHTFSWDKDGMYKELGETISVPLQRNSFRLRSKYVLEGTFESYLSDAGVKFTHPEKDFVTLDDLFVYPDLRRLNLPGEKGWSSAVIREEVPLYIFNNRRVLLVGNEKCGKTALAKSLYKDMRRYGIVPILLTGERIRKSDENYLYSQIEKSFSKQYKSPNYEGYRQLGKLKRAIIIDDFHKVRVNARGRDLILKTLTAFFEVVILISDEQLRYDNFISSEAKELQLWQFPHCEMLAFGHLRRSDLIEKWILLGRGLTQSQSELSKRITQIEKNLSKLLGSNFIPPYPLFILVMLQQIEAKIPVDTTSTSGSYGYIYEALLTMALARTSKLKLDLDTQYNYLAELAYSLFKRRENAINKYEAMAWHQEYCQTYKLNLVFEDILEAFREASILREDGYSISFCYPYLYFYFVARYFRDHIDEEPIRETITLMSQRLHHRESANIIMILSHLSKNPFIISSILDASRNLFTSHPECDLLNHSQFLTNVLKSIPEFVLDSSHPDERRKQMLARQDEIEDELIEDEPEAIAIEEINVDKELDEFNQINVAFKTIQILGQVLRNYLGSMKGDQKLELASEAFSLGLRVLKYMFEVIKETQNELIEIFTDLVRYHHPEWSDERLAKRVENFIFNLLEGLAFVIIKQVSDSIGDERLAITLKELVTNSDNISYKYIDLSVKLDYYRGFPKVEAKNLYKEVHESLYPSQIVRHLVWYYFYLYPANYALRQSLCKLFNIKLQPYVVHDPRPKLLKTKN